MTKFCFLVTLIREISISVRRKVLKQSSWQRIIFLHSSQIIILRCVVVLVLMVMMIGRRLSNEYSLATVYYGRMETSLFEILTLFG